MKSLFAFVKKEFLEHVRSGRLILLCVLFVLLGIMNPAIAKLTPWMMEMLADSMAESGFVVMPVTVNALDAWMQFFKNIPIGLIAFVLLENGIFTREYQTGTLLLSLTKGLERHKAVIAKAAVLSVLWTAGYWLCAGITWAYSAYFWDNAAARNLGLSLACYWVFGLWTVGLMVFFSVLSKSGTGVLLGTGGVVLACTLLGMLPRLGKVLPTLLADGTSLIYGASEAKAYALPLVIAAATALACLLAGISLFNKKQL